MTGRNLKRAALVAVALAVASAGQLAAAGAERSAITMWWVIFNNPEACFTTPCGVDDLENPAAEPSAVYATGRASGHGGSLRLVASLYETGEGFADLDPNTSVIGGPGLVDSQKAEIQLWLRSHGRIIPRIWREQITVYLDPGCQDLGGPNVCEEVQLAIHSAGDDSVVPLLWFDDRTVVEDSASELIRLDGGVKAILHTSLARGK